MRKLTAGLFITLDGVTEEPSAWQETFDEEMGAALSASMTGVDALLLGRHTYDYWAAYWPHYQGGDDQGYADFINHTPKYVVSSTLKEAPWGKYEPAKVIQGDVAGQLQRLKEQPGGVIAVQGSPTLVNSLLQLGMLDELQLYIHNVVAYQGQHLFREGDLKRLTLVDAQPTSSGVLVATYRARPSYTNSD